MKKVINENTIRQIVRESLKSYLKESMDFSDDDYTWDDNDDYASDMEDMELMYGNQNRFDDGSGAMASMLSQGDDDSYLTKKGRSLRSTESDSMDAFSDMMDDDFDPTYNSQDDIDFFNKHYSNVVNEAVNKALKKVLKKK